MRLSFRSALAAPIFFVWSFHGVITAPVARIAINDWPIWRSGCLTPHWSRSEVEQLGVNMSKFSPDCSFVRDMGLDQRAT